MRSPEAAPLVGFGATPQLFRVKPTQRKKSTRRRQRSVPASNFAHPQMRPQLALPTTRTLSRQMGATDQHREKWFSCCWSFLLHGFRLCGGDQRALRSPSGLLRSTLQCYLIFIVAGGCAPVGATRGQRRRYPFLKYSPLCCTIPSAFCTIAGRRCWVMSASITS